MYPPPHQYGSYFLAPALSYQPTVTTTSATSSVGTSQVALPTAPPPPSGFFYGGYTYPYSAGRIVAPVLALAPPQAASIYPYGPPPPMAPPPATAEATPVVSVAEAPAAPPTLLPQQPKPPTASDVAKNSQAGPQVVGKGSNSSKNQQDLKNVASKLVTPPTTNVSSKPPTGVAKPQVSQTKSVKKAQEEPLVSISATGGNSTQNSKSSLRDYRRPSKPKPVATTSK
jgi:hypothetical protein